MPRETGSGRRQGPLAGLKVVEMAGIGPAPMCAMLLADAGADVVRIDRPSPSGLGIDKPVRFDLLARSRRSVAVDLKHPDGVALVLDLVREADALIEGFRPGTMERLGLGPDVCLAAKPPLVYGRVTGWGQTGPLAHAAGHDLNYIALSGALHATGRAGAPPTPPLNLVGDFGGGALYLAFGLMAALLHARETGRGQVVDAAMVEGAASLMTMFYGMRAAGLHADERGANLLDSAAPHYEVYECADGLFLSVAPIEGKFRDVLLKTIGIGPESLPDVGDSASWPRAKAMLAARFREKTRAEWCARLEGTDACVAPVLSMAEAPSHAHNAARGSFVTVDGVVQPGPAPRFLGTPSDPPTPPEPAGASTAAALRDWGIGPDRIAELLVSGTIGIRTASGEDREE
ncbi:CaiB/BaiF CoA transferase family protein [Enterovirga aerilata]|uniref:CoA transferase n=1 Tax=Enterovirga aerilata TaxID=2730920 RepID=A0A849I622_9HYPH|nr:CaiB/BaiF CoA-transferase family protein [Enterovirga sp. DB1703]NNM72771.1 CoA transferase [Enterovirga sp. DB1703]